MIDKLTALDLRYGQILYHKRLRNSDGTALRCRVNGKCKTWMRPSWRHDEGDFQLPVKHGLKHCFYVTPRNGEEWQLTDPTEDRKAAGLAQDTPEYAVHDKLVELGLR